MLSRIFSVIAIIFVMVFEGCSRDFSPVATGQVRPLTPLEKKLVRSSNDFGFNLFKEVAREDSSENIFVSAERVHGPGHGPERGER